MTAAPRARVQRRPVHGVLLLDKPLGLSSNQALQKAKWLLRAEKAGHTGTLDPLATGVLPLCLGAATKFSALHLDADKAYEATLQLGVSTTTGDAEGQITECRPVPAITPAQLEAVRQRFEGDILQVPPMHSALKKDGKALYEYARAGVQVERPPRPVRIHALRLTLLPTAAAEKNGKPTETRMDTASAAIKIEVTCSKGTYIRTLGEDIGQALGCGGHLSALRRTATGPFRQEQCITLDALERMDETRRLAQLLPIETLLPGHSRITLPNDEAGRFLSGMRRRGPWPDAEHVAVFGNQPRALLGTAHVKAGELIATRLLTPVEIGQMLAQQGNQDAI